jgi:hypothetical protein
MEIEDRSWPLALHCIQFLQSGHVGNCEDKYQNGQHEI